MGQQKSLQTRDEPEAQRMIQTKKRLGDAAVNELDLYSTRHFMISDVEPALA
jgi:hypothetical protein